MRNTPLWFLFARTPLSGPASLDLFGVLLWHSQPVTPLNYLHHPFDLGSPRPYLLFEHPAIFRRLIFFGETITNRKHQQLALCGTPVVPISCTCGCTCLGKAGSQQWMSCWHQIMFLWIMNAVMVKCYKYSAAASQFYMVQRDHYCRLVLLNKH